MTTLTLDAVVAAALQLSPADRRQLIALVRPTLVAETEQKALANLQPAFLLNIAVPAIDESQTWGEQAIALFDSLDTDDWRAMDMPDVTAWVRQLREDQMTERLGDAWSADE